MQESNIGRDITHVWTAAEAIKALETKIFDEVFLDHDLGGVATEMTLPDLDEGSGYDVATYIANMPADKRPYKVTIHSYNPAGAKRMEAVLMKCSGLIVSRKPFDY